MATERKEFKNLVVSVEQDNDICLGDRVLEWKYYVLIADSPKELATELRAIADWLDQVRVVHSTLPDTAPKTKRKA